MKESYIEGVATRDGPQLCAGIREAVSEALTGIRIGWDIVPRNQIDRGADVVAGIARASANHRPGRGRPPLPRDSVSAAARSATEPPAPHRAATSSYGRYRRPVLRADSLARFLADGSPA